MTLHEGDRRKIHIDLNSQLSTMSGANTRDGDIAQDEVSNDAENAVINSNDSMNIDDNNKEDKFNENNEEEDEDDDSALSLLYYATNIQQVMTSKFVLFQVFVNTIGSLIGPLITFYLLFGVASQGPYEWNGSQCIGVVVGSLVGSPFFIFALIPVGMPEALKRGWFYQLRMEDVVVTPGGGYWLFLLPFLRDGKIWRYAMIRHVVLGLILGIVYVPIAILIARYGFGTFSTWELIFFNVIYLVCLAPPVTIFGLLGYAMEHNLSMVVEQMTNDPNPCKRLVLRSAVSIRMIVCCR